MNDETDKLDALARRLIGHEGGESGDAMRVADAADKVCQKLRGRLAIIIGQGGFSAILEHAVNLTRAEFPFLPVDLARQGSPCLKGMQESARGQDPALVRDAVARLLANFLVTLVSLVGRDLSYIFLRAAWPSVEID